MMRASTSSEEPKSAPEVDQQQLYMTLNEYLQLETKFQPRLCLADGEDQQDEVSIGARDGAAHVLRCLKVCYGLPADVLFHAINLFDRFLTKMKVRPSHVPCITVSCMNIAIECWAKQHDEKRKVSVEELVAISQSACTARDVIRMSCVIQDKLSLGQLQTITVLHWLRLFKAVLEASQLHYCQEEELTNLLEITACDYNCVNARTSELALVLLYHKLESQIVSWSRVASEGGPPVPEDAFRIFQLAANIQDMCNMSDSSLVSTRQLVRSVLVRYESKGNKPIRQRLLWRLSERTLKVLRPIDRLTSMLPTIEEQQMISETTTPRKRTGSDSSLSEEMSTWPRSPVLPVYCDH